jgi:hypothetical protein
MTSTQTEDGTWLHVVDHLGDRKRRVDLQVTSGKTIQPTYTSAPQGLSRIAQDGERNGRLGWTPGT